MNPLYITHASLAIFAADPITAFIVILSQKMFDSIKAYDSYMQESQRLQVEGLQYTATMGIAYDTIHEVFP